MSPFSRDGHLHTLGIEQLVAGELPQEAVAMHLASCPRCTERVARVREDERRPLPALRGTRRRDYRWGGLAVGLALAAALVLTFRSPADRETFTPKGSDLSLEVFLDEGASTRQLGWNDAVAQGDRIGFRAGSRHGATLLILGVDATGRVYPCWPTDGVARPVPATLAPVDLAAAVRLDATPGAERILAIGCSDGFDIENLDDAAVGRAYLVGPDERLPLLRPGCAQDEVRLEKEP
jgi:hypothetical protein